MAVDQTSPTTRLLTLLNVSAAKSTKRKRHEEDSAPIPKLNKRRSLEPASEPEKNEKNADATQDSSVPADGDDGEDDVAEAAETQDDSA